MRHNITGQLILYTVLGIIIVGLLSLQEVRPMEYFIPMAYLTISLSLIFYIVVVKEKYINKFKFITMMLLIFLAIFIPLIINLILNPDHWFLRQL